MLQGDYRFRYALYQLFKKQHDFNKKIIFITYPPINTLKQRCKIDYTASIIMLSNNLCYSLFESIVPIVPYIEQIIEKNQQKKAILVHYNGLLKEDWPFIEQHLKNYHVTMIQKIQLVKGESNGEVLL